MRTVFGVVMFTAVILVLLLNTITAMIQRDTSYLSAVILMWVGWYSWTMFVYVRKSTDWGERSKSRETNEENV